MLGHAGDSHFLVAVNLISLWYLSYFISVLSTFLDVNIHRFSYLHR